MINEFLIKIKAETDKARKEIEKVNKELGKIQDTGTEAGKAIDASMKAIARGAAIATAAIAGITTAMVAFGKSTLDVQRQLSKLNTAFINAGSTTEQAAKTYKDLYRFLGDSGKATEAAGHLAKLTTSEEELAEWAKIAQGVYATFGDSLPIESLTEAANETVKVGTVTGAMADALNWAGVSEDAFNNSLATTTSLSEREALVRSTLNGLYMNAANIYERNNKALLQNAESQARLDIALAQAGRIMLPLMTSVNNLATTFLTSFAPAIQVVSIYLTAFIQLIAEAIQWVGSFFGMLGSSTGKTTADVAGYKAAMDDYLGSLTGGFKKSEEGISDNISKIKELKKQTMGFDELNIVSSQSAIDASGAAGGSGGGGGIGTIGAPPNPADYGISADALDTTKIAEDIAKAKEYLKGVLVLVAAVAAGFALWKIADLIGEISAAKSILDNMDDGLFYKKIFGEKAQEYLDNINTKFQYFGGLALAIAGAIALVAGYSDAWVNGIDWGNLALMLGGIAAVVGGIALAFGPVAAGVAALVGGIALIVIGVKDFIENGYSMESVLTILAGVLAVIVGVCLAFNAALLANPITWVIAGIAALVAAFVILWNECEGFRNFWIAVWEKAKDLFAAFVKSIQPLIDAIVAAFKEAWELIKVIWNKHLVPLFKAAWEAIKAVWDAVKPYFKAIWENIKSVFSVVKDVLGSFFKAAWEAIKIVWNQVVNYFTAIWTTIAGIFSVVKNVLSGNWSEAWEAIKGIVNTWGDYFKNTWENIKKIFSVVSSYFKEVFGAAWNGIKQIFSNWGSFFSGLWNKIKNTFSSLGTSIGNAISNAVKAGINGVISLIENRINSAISLINGAIKLINKLPGVNVSTIGKLSLPRLAEGGIVTDSILANIGERGKEAVLPLENNTEWMDKLADRIAARNSNPTKVILKVGERELGWATIGAINGITEQTGGLQLVL